GLVGTGEHLDQGGLPGPVLAEQTVHLACLGLEIDAVEGTDTRERLGDPGHGEQGWFRGHGGFPSRAGRRRAGVVRLARVRGGAARAAVRGAAVRLLVRDAAFRLALKYVTLRCGSRSST